MENSGCRGKARSIIDFCIKGRQVVNFACHLLARWFAEPISSTLKMEAICSSETSVDTQQTTRRHIPKYDTLQVVNLLFNSFVPMERDSDVQWIDGPCSRSENGGEEQNELYPC
jgi:hypothetical protein